MLNNRTPQMDLEEQRKRESQKWYAGDAPTRGETLTQIGRIYQQDKQAGLNAFKSFMQLSSDPSSAMYSPYMSATNNSTRQSFAQYGVDTSNVNDAWFESNAWMKQYNRVGSTGNVLGTAKSATDAQNMASLYADLYDQEQTTKKAETEWAALQDEVRYWTSRADLNMSDDEILAKINWGNYPTLAKMDEAATAGAPVFTTRAVGYDKDLLKGVIYQTRNNGGSGDLLMDSAHYYSGMGNQYTPDEAVRARFTYGSATYNPYVVSGTINDLGLYFGEGSFDRTWLEKNADILNGTNETAKKNYHKVQDAVSLTEKANDELAKLNADIDRLVGMGVSADNIMGTIDRYLEEGTYPTLNKLQGSIETGELLSTASPINFDYASIRSMVDEKVNAKGASPEQANEAEGIDIVNHNGSDAEKAFFASMAALDYDEQVNQMWLGMDGGELDGDYMARSYETLANSFNKKWASGAEDAIGGYAEYQDALHAQTEAIMTIERSDAYKRLKELGYAGEANDYQAINNFMNEQISDEDYEAVWESMHTMLADLAQAEYNADWVAENKYIGEEYKNDYSALEAFRRRAMVQGNLSIDPLLRNGEDYSIMDYAGVTADDMVSQVVAANEGVSSQEAAAHVATVYGDEKARLESEIATLEQSGYSGKTLDNKRNKLAAVERILGDVERNSVQNNADFAEKSAAGEAKIDTATLEPDSYNAKVTKDGNIAVSLMVYNHMTDEERARLHYYAETDPEQAIAYLDELTDDTYGVIPYRVHGTVSESAKKFAADHPVLATAASVITSPLQLAGTAYSVAQGLQGKELNPHSRFMVANAFVGQTRAQVAEDIDVATQDNPVLNFFSKVAYSAVTSGAESLLFGAAGKIGLPMMVSANMSSTVQNALQRGASTTEALLLGGASGLVEYATEKIPFDALTDAMKGGKAAAKGFKENFVRIVTDAAKTGSQDAAGEGLSEWAGNVADQLIMKDKSQHNIAVKTYLAEREGATEEEAEKAVFKDEMMDVLSASVSGFISSGANVAAAETYNTLTGNVEQEPAAETKRTADPRLARKMANLEAVALSGDNPSPSITAALTSETDATSTIAKAVTLEAQRIFGDNTASALSGIYGAAYDAGVSDAEITSALKKSLAPGNADGKVQLQELTQDGASTGRIKTFVQNMQNAPEFTHADAREVLINEQQRVIFEESTTYEGLRSALEAESNAKNAYTKAQQVVGKVQLQRSASVKEMNKAMAAYNESLTNPNGNTQTAIQHAYMIAIDNVANFNSAFEAANRRMQEAKAKYDAAISNYKEVSKRILADVRAKAEKMVDQALMEAENKTVSELSSAAKPVTDTAADGSPKRDDSEIRNAVIEEMREAGLLDELTDINRQIAEYEQKLAGSHKKNSLSKAIRRAKDHLVRKRAELSSVVDDLVAQEVARIETTQPETQAMKTEFVEMVRELVSEEDVQVSGVDPVDLKKMQEAYVTTLRDYKQAKADAKAAMNDADDPDNPFLIYDENEVNRIAVPFEEKFQSALGDLMDIAPKLNPIALKNLPVKGQLVWGNNTIEEDGTVYRYALIDKAEIKGTEYEKINSPRIIGETSEGVNIYSKEPSVFIVSPEGEVVEGFWIAKAAKQSKYGSDKLKEKAFYYGFKPNEMRADRLLMKIPLSAETAKVYKATKSIDPVETQTKAQPEASARVMAESTGINRDADTATIPMTQKTQGTYTSDGDDYDALLEQYGAIEQGENPVNDMPVPKRVDDELKVMRGVRTAREAFTNEQLPAEVIKEIVVDERATYQADTNAKQIAWAQNELAQGYDHAVGVWESAIDGGNIPNARQIALGSMLVHEAVGRGDTAMAQKTIVELAEVETRAGQTVQASRILKKLGNNALLYYTVRAESEINRRLAKKGVHISVDETLAANLMKAKTDQEKMDATQAIINDLAAKLPRTWRDKANALAYLSMLSSPVTHVKNFAGNAANLPLAAIENAVGTAIDKLRPQDKRTHVLNIDKAYLDFAKKDYAETKDSDKGDRYKITAGAVYAARTPFADKGIGKALNKVSDVESKFLKAGDRVYKNMYYPRLMASYLQAQGVDLKNIPQNTLIKARKYADRKSKEYLYQDDGAAVQWIQKGYEIPVFGEALRAVMPFAKTPINIAKRSMEFSVIGGVANIAYQGKKNGWGSNEVVEAISKSVAGGAMHVVGFLLANAGILVPSLGDDPEDQMAELRGSQAYALEIGDTSYTISWAGPAATEMLLGAEIAKAFDGKFTVDELVGSGLNLLNPLLDNTFLDGIVDLLSIGQYTQGGADLAGEVVAQLGSSYMAQYFPAALGAIARTIDATRRSTTTDPNSPIPESLQYQFAKMLNKIPGISMTRPAWTDEFGQPDKTDGWLQRALENLVFPWYQNELKSDDIVLNEINKIYVATGGTDKALVPEMAAKSFSESNAKHKLGGDDYVKMNELHGKIQRDALEDLFSRPEWAEIDPYIKAEMIKDVYSYADNASRVDYVSTSPFSDSWQADAYKNGNIVDVVLGRAEKHAQSTWGKLYAAEVVGFALRNDWESATERAMEMTIAYPLGASLSMKQARTKIESALKTKLQEGDAEITLEEYDTVMQLYALGMIDSTLVDELMAQ